MNHASIRARVAKINQQAEDRRHRAEPAAWGISLAIVLGIVGACLLAHWCAL